MFSLQIPAITYPRRLSNPHHSNNLATSPNHQFPRQKTTKPKPKSPRRRKPIPERRPANPMMKRIPQNITKRRQPMIKTIHLKPEIPLLPQSPRPQIPPIKILPITNPERIHKLPQILRKHRQMHMIRHQSIRQQNRSTPQKRPPKTIHPPQIIPLTPEHHLIPRRKTNMKKLLHNIPPSDPTAPIPISEQIDLHQRDRNIQNPSQTPTPKQPST